MEGYYFYKNRPKFIVMDKKNMIKATKKDKEQTQTLLNGVKDKPIFADKIEVINELFKKAVIIDNSQTA